MKIHKDEPSALLLFALGFYSLVFMMIAIIGATE